MSNFTGERLAARASTRRIPELDGLRAIAIVFVIGCHYPAFASSLYGLPAYGWVGVEIFFVLSGFLITSILLPLKGTSNPYLPFLERRAARIMPPYFLVLLVVALIYWARDRAQISDSMDVLWRSVIFSSSMQNNLDYLARVWRVAIGTAHSLPLLARTPLATNLPGITTFDFRSSVGHFWSVSVEEWYYVLWAPVVLVLRRQGIAVTGVLLIVVAFLARWFGFINWEWYVSFPCRCDMLAMGGLLALWMELRSSLPPEQQRFWDRRLHWVAAIAAGCLGLLFLRLWPFLGRDIRGSVSFAAFGPLFLAVAVAGVLAILLNRSMSNQLLCRALRVSPCVYVGRRSYMIYLVHVPVYMLVARTSQHWFQAYRGNLWIVALVSAGLSLGIAALSWRFFESPILRFRDKHSTQLRRTVVNTVPAKP